MTIHKLALIASNKKTVIAIPRVFLSQDWSGGVAIPDPG